MTVKLTCIECGELLTSIEIEAKHQVDSDEFICYECFADHELGEKNDDDLEKTIFDELKPCPFCGKVVVMRTKSWGAMTDELNWEIECTGLNCFLYVIADAVGEELVEQWNKRIGEEKNGSPCQACE